MPIELEPERLGAIAQPVEVAIKLGNSVLGIEAHRLDQVEAGSGSVHISSLKEALGPLLTHLAVDDKP